MYYVLQPMLHEDRSASRTLTFARARARTHTHARTRTHTHTYSTRTGTRWMNSFVHAYVSCKCERDPICVCLPLYLIRMYRRTHILSFDPGRGIAAKEKKRKFTCSRRLLGVLDLLAVCSTNDCAATAVEKLSVRVSSPPPPLRFLDSPPFLGRDRGLSNEESLQAAKHSRRKCREHNHLKLLRFRLTFLDETRD